MGLKLLCFASVATIFPERKKALYVNISLTEHSVEDLVPQMLTNQLIPWS
jgi:hypothetical protein